MPRTARSQTPCRAVRGNFQCHSFHLRPQMDFGGLKMVGIVRKSPKKSGKVPKKSDMSMPKLSVHMRKFRLLQIEIDAKTCVALKIFIIFIVLCIARYYIFYNFAASNEWKVKSEEPKVTDQREIMIIVN